MFGSSRYVFYSLDLFLFLQGLELTFPIEDSLLTCYKGRQSCVDNDLPSEVSTSYDYRWFEIMMIKISTLNPGWDFGEEFLWPARVFRSLGRALWEGGAYGYRGGGGAMMDSLIRRLIERVCEFYASPEDHLFWIPSKCVFLAPS